MKMKPIEIIMKVELHQKSEASTSPNTGRARGTVEMTIPKTANMNIL